jgi:single-stranded-DNA-specific exonuclease
VARAHWEALAASDPDALEAALISAIIGDRTPHEAQIDILSRLKAGTSTLGVMATGRGKSLIFQVFAAELALSQNKASLFVYPLRALMADQAFHLSRQFEKFGLVCAVLNGETTQPERLRIYDALATGKVDIVLTTPEYLSFHADEIAKSGRIGFVVVDEAHHIGQAKAGTRPAYKTLGEVVDALGAPVVLAVTATSPTQVARDIIGTLPIVEHVIDDHSRDNLHLDDQRNIPNRDDYLAHIVAGGGKCVIYVNSRDQSVSVARRLRARVPQLAPYIGFYNAGLGKCERARIEDLFRSGKLQVLVATSAFGEGIDIPDIRHVVLYHMPFSDVEFNQMSGRAGRDGRASWVHLLYSESDASINEGLLADMTPARDTMAQIYRAIRDCAQTGISCAANSAALGSTNFCGDGARAAQNTADVNMADRQTDSVAGCFVPVDLESLARAATNSKFHITPTSAACAVSVFNELGLIEARETFTGGQQTHSVRMRSRDGKVELTDSIRYREGLDEILKFREFREWALRSDAHTLTIRITHPITPDLPPQ